MQNRTSCDEAGRAGSGDGQPVENSSAVSAVLPVTVSGTMIPVVPLSDGHGVLPITLSIGQVIAWTGLKKTKVQELANEGELVTSKVAGRTLWLTCSVIALIERNRVERGR